MHNLARDYSRWLHAGMMPAGGVMATQFTDDTLSEVLAYSSRRDSAIWTGTYLASEALRFMTTQAPDAARQIRDTLETLHLWWRIPGDPGYLARYAAPADSPAPIQAILSDSEEEVHRDVLYEGERWHWRGNISRDQYQGVMLGYSFAYEATQSPALRELIRKDVVDFIEQLMRSEEQPVAVRVGNSTLSTQVRIPYAVFSKVEAPDGEPALTLTLDPFEAAGKGVLFFSPNAAELVRQLPGLGGFANIYQPTESIQLGAMFNVALQVTEGVSEYAERRQAIAQHYEAHADEWLDIATGWRNSNQCADAYFGLNIGFMPLYSWIRLEQDPARKLRLQREVLRDAMWEEVKDHKNVFFAFIYASQAAAEDEVQSVADFHADQLARFPTAPNLALPRDLTGKYPESEQCEGLSAVAVNVDERVPASFTWERQPWKLVDGGTPNQVYGGVDYLMAYWMGRYYGFIADDAPGTCLLWRRDQ
ncbi:hypothetical protein G3480_23430 [Thiorhodococcus mannitoliphagus]|uniref:Uncharacterized protein n=1 Tax=Thiorhodococcus mannitoliphagus TaxID=329406 RepID=A0A6P1E1X7_9GAMM|nr:hypothetical protein [Thiorhodococcus mannitoliphagus]NEX23213.1 hypothetical protein [Thiorhodococcus mannitoliphagus]